MPPNPSSVTPAPTAVLADELWFSCPECKGELMVPIALADTHGACPLCGKDVHIPPVAEKWGGENQADDPELEGSSRKAFRGDLHITKAKPDPKASKRGFFDPEAEPSSTQPLTPPAPVASVTAPVSLPALKLEKPAGSAFDKPIRKYTGPVTPKAAEPAPVASVTAPVSLPVLKVEPVVEEVAAAPVPAPPPPEVVAIPPVSETVAFKPMRKFPPKPRRPILPPPPPEVAPVPIQPQEVEAIQPVAEPVLVAQPPIEEPPPTEAILPEPEPIPVAAIEVPTLEAPPVAVALVEDEWQPIAETPAEPFEVEAAPEPVVHSQPEHQVIRTEAETEEPRRFRIGGVRMPHYTLVPRGTPFLVWAQRVAIVAVVALPVVLLTPVLMPRLTSAFTWYEGVRDSVHHLEESQKEVKAKPDYASPAAQELRDQALESMRHEWSKLTASPAKAAEPKPNPSPAGTRTVAFRSSRVEPRQANPETDWPQLLLRNYGTFLGHSPMDGASSFIIEANDGSHWVATSAHLLGSSGGVEPPLEPGRLRNALHRWRAFLPEKPDTFVEIAGGRTLNWVVTEDWLAMRMNDKSVLPVKPLQLRARPVRDGEPVFLVGLPYNDRSGALQHVYRGQITPSSQVNAGQFAFVVQAEVDFSGFRGAPILDADGDVVGVLTDRWATVLVGTKAELLVPLVEKK